MGKNVHWYEAATMEQSVVFAQIGNSCIPRRGQPYVEAAITETWEYNAVKILINNLMISVLIIHVIMVNHTMQSRS